MKTIHTRTVVIGSGCAGFNAADCLHSLGERDFLLVTEGMKKGTSRNTGSDKQTYYKLSLSGAGGDSPEALARTLLSDGVNGDTALIEAACSAQCFLKLVQLGVPFPCNEFGEFVGYQTDHDNRMRATSAGPLTSKYMTEALESQVLKKGIRILDHTVAFHLVVNDNKVAGVVCYDTKAKDYVCILCAHIILATGGPAQIYRASVYPESQTGMSGMALAAGVVGANLHQWQYGIASTGFRWNVSGSYQQALPRYVSIDQNGVEREFLFESMDPMEAVYCCFLKGYQWPFDIQKVSGSSSIDLLVHREREQNRRVYLDFRRNPSCINSAFDGLHSEAMQYLEKCGAVQGTPYQRLLHMNAPAVALYRGHGIDLAQDLLEIGVCAQHCNGGVAVDMHWQTNIEGLYAAGEVAGTFGEYRPGGSALNSTQVGGMRAAQHIAWDSQLEPINENECSRLLLLCPPVGFSGDLRAVDQAKDTMSRYGGNLRDLDQLKRHLKKVESLLSQCAPVAEMGEPVVERLKARDLLLTQRAVMDAMIHAGETFGSAGAGLVLDPNATGARLADRMRMPVSRERSYVVLTELNPECKTKSVPARPLPKREDWFENVWRKHRERTQQRGKRGPCAHDGMV